MKIFSPKFLEKLSQDYELRNKIVYKFVKEDCLCLNLSDPEEDIFEIVKNSKRINFDGAVEWICSQMLSKEPEYASSDELEKMRTMIKQFVESNKPVKKSDFVQENQYS